jgi:cell division transport system permease protein
MNKHCFVKHRNIKGRKVHLWGMAYSRRKNNNRLPASQATTTFTTVVGMTLTLVLIGLLSVLSFLGSRWEKQLRQEVRIQVYFLRDLDTESLHTALSIVETEESVAEAKYIDPATAAKKLEQDLGESFVEFLGYVPLPPAMDVRIKADFSTSEKLSEVVQRLENIPGVADVVWQDQLLAKIERTINRLMIPLISIASICLFIALALMNNTVRLTVFARRFLIRNMQLVGARPGFIRRPFLKQGFILGVSSGLLSFAFITAALALLKSPLGSEAVILDVTTMGMLAGGLVVLGGGLGVISTALAVNRYLRLDVGQLH